MMTEYNELLELVCQKQKKNIKDGTKTTAEDDVIYVAETDDVSVPAIENIEKRCKDETRKAYDASKKGAAIRLLDAQREESENALYSGGSIQAVRQYISNVFNKAGIPDSVAKNLLMLSEK